MMNMKPVTEIMPADALRNISTKYCPRFGRLAVEMGFITVPQLEVAASCQIIDMCTGREHRLLGRILLDKEWMTGDQIELVLNRLMKMMRIEDMEADSGTGPDLGSMAPSGECNG